MTLIGGMLFKIVLLSSINLSTITSHLPSQAVILDQPDSYPDVISCLKAIDATLLTPESSAWAEAIRPYNLRISPRPAAVISPKDIEGIKDVIRCARIFPGTRLSPLCGGHSFASYGLGGKDLAVVVNMRNFKSLKILAPQDGVDIVKVGGGVLVRELTVFLLKNGGFYWAHVRCMEVGLAGSAIGGGFGTASRLLGTTLDNVVAVEIISPDGNLIRATAEKHCDIFFAVLGAGSSFGIIVSLEIRIYKPYPNPVSYLYQWNKPTIEQAVTTFGAFQDYGLRHAPPQLSLRLRMGLPGSLTFEGIYYGDMENFRASIEPLLSQLPTPKVSNVSTVTFTESEISSSGSLDGPPTTRPSTISYTNSLLTFEPLPAETIKGFLSNLMTRSEEKNSTGFRMRPFADLWGGKDSYSTKVPKSETGIYSFTHKNALLLIRADGVIMNSTDPTAWPDDGIRFVQSITKPLFDSQKPIRSYPNYRDTAYDQNQWSSRYYASAYPILQKIKARVDPGGIMSANPQSIEPVRLPTGGINPNITRTEPNPICPMPALSTDAVI